MPRDRDDRLSAIAVGRRAAAEAIAAGRAQEVLLAEGRASEGMRALVDSARRARVRVRRVSLAELDRLAADHRGVVVQLTPEQPEDEFP